MPSPVAACALPGRQGDHQPVGQFTLCLFEGLGHRLHRIPADQDIALCGIVRPRESASPGVALVAGKGRRPALGIHQAYLPASAAFIRGNELTQGLFGTVPLGHQRQAIGPERGVGIGLGCHRSDTGLRPRNDGAHSQELGLHCNAPLLRFRIVADDGKRRRRDSMDHVSHSFRSRVLGDARLSAATQDKWCSQYTHDQHGHVVELLGTFLIGSHVGKGRHA